MGFTRLANPMANKKTICMEPIGYVKTKAVGDEVKDRSRASEIVLKPEFVEALDGVAEYSHLYVLFWLHEITPEKRCTLKIHPRGRADLPLVGIFAARTNLRPNPIGLTIVELLKLTGNVLAVRGLDAFDGTPVLDLKPYDRWDKVADIAVPTWWEKLEKEKTKGD
jgi:tRNA (adenine37-N6)-methyltransferase